MIAATFYKFFNVPNVAEAQRFLEQQAESLGLRGLVILAPEGFNSTVSGEEASVDEFIQRLQQEFFSGEQIYVKKSPAPTHPFRIFKVKVREEVVTTTRPDLNPINAPVERKSHLTPTEWNNVLKNEKDVFLVDTRNWYETQIGTFKGAVDPNIKEFTEFPHFIARQNLPKDKKILMFCTGGIRCEKGILDMEAQGYHNVFQLEGGILNYFKEYPNDLFDGECFVFDHRVAVKQDLTPSETYKLCPHCGQPGTIAIDCARCDHHAVICKDCSEKTEALSVTCSKNCAHHWSSKPGQKGPRQNPSFQFSNVKG